MFNGPPPERLGEASSRSASTFCAVELLVLERPEAVAAQIELRLRN
jgi:hypothetical protein